MKQTKSLILVKIESTYGTDSTPSPTVDAIIVHGEPSIEPSVKDLSREISIGTFGKITPPRIGESIKISFKAEINCSGVLGTPPAIGPLLRACGFTQAISEGASVSYTPHSSFATESVTIWFYKDGIKHVVTGCVGSVKWDWKDNEVMTLDFEMTGMFADAHAADTTWPASITLPSGAPSIFRAANFKFNSITDLVCDSFSFDLGNAISPRNDFNAATGIKNYYVSDRTPKGSFNPEAVALSVLNPWTLATAGTANTMEIKPAGTAASLIEVAIAGAVLDTPKYGSREQVLSYDLSFQCNPTLTTGDNEIIFTFK